MINNLQISPDQSYIYDGNISCVYSLDRPFLIDILRYKRVYGMGGVYSAFAAAKSCQLRFSA